MDSRTTWKWLFLIGSTVVSVAVASRGIPLGLDLRGGVSFIVQIKEEDLIRNLRDGDEKFSDEQIPKEVKRAQERAVVVIRNRIDVLGLREPSIYSERNNRIVIQLPGIDKKTMDDTENAIQQVGSLAFRLVHENNDRLVQELWDKGATPDGYKIADVSGSGGRRQRGGKYYIEDKGVAKVPASRLRSFHAPPKYDFMLMPDKVSGREVYTPVFVHKWRELTGEHLKAAHASLGSVGEPMVNIEFDSKGTKAFQKITSDYVANGRKNATNVGRRLGIVLDDVLHSAPVLKSVIYDGRAVIEGIESHEEARRLGGVLQAGSLPAPVEIIEKERVEPSLGKDSMTSGVRASILGGILVVLFMAAYYLRSGLIADFAVLLDLVLMPLGMVLAAGFLGIFTRGGGGTGASGLINLPTLTLPGIAGIVLTIGMAVDANVLINERIREELNLGKTIKAAIAAGYHRAFSAIFDSNLTTVIAAVIMFVIGSGAVRGYAITLTGGIIVSMYTAVVVTRMVLDLLTANNRLTSLRMLTILKDVPKIDFIGKQWYAIGASGAIILATWALLLYNGYKDPSRVLGVDFTGGSSVTFQVKDDKSKPSVAEIRDTLADAGVGDATIQYKWALEGKAAGQLLVRAGTALVQGAKPGDVIKKAIVDRYGSVGIEEGVEVEVGPQVGAEMRRGSVIAVGLALLAMAIYVMVRFEFSYALGAMASLFHDVLVTVGVYCAFSHQINMNVIAAVLTVIGYSVNDTIVIFDRIRENVKNSELRKKMSYREICNLSVNQTLSRTLLTSFTALMAVLMLLVFGGGAVRDLALALFVGMIAGVYSTVYIATPVVLLWHPEGRTPAKSA